MKAYEIVYVMDASLEREAVDAKLDAFHSALGGEVTALDHWGVRQLAYPIAKAQTAYYAVAQFSADPTALPEFERLVKLDEEVLRHLIVLNKGQSTSGASLLASRPHASHLADEASEDDADQLEADPLEADDGAAHAADESDAASAPGEPEAAEAAAIEGEAAAAEGEAAPDESADDESAGPAPPPRSGPPEFSGTRGRRRRHEGPPVVLLNYKDVATLSRFLTEQGKILPKRTTRVTAAFQRQLGAAVKRARFLALLPYTKDHVA